MSEVIEKIDQVAESLGSMKNELEGKADTAKVESAIKQIEELKEFQEEMSAKEIDQKIEAINKTVSDTAEKLTELKEDMEAREAAAKSPEQKTQEFEEKVNAFLTEVKER